MQGVNPITGQPAYRTLSQYPQNYYVMPNESPWVDGFTADSGRVAQFVVVDRASGLAVADHLLPFTFTSDQLSIAVYRARYQPHYRDEYPGYETFRGGKAVGAGGDIQQHHTVDYHDPSYWTAEPETTFVWTFVTEYYRPPTRPKRPPVPGYRPNDSFLDGVPRI